MKKHFIYTVPGFICFLLVMSSCFHVHDHDVSITTTEDEEEYEMNASFNRNKNHAVRVYLNDHLLNNGRSLKTTGEVILDDNTIFYINSYPGKLNIKIDKARNSEESCERLRVLCEELKEILEDN